MGEAFPEDIAEQLGRPMTGAETHFYLTRLLRHDADVIATLIEENGVLPDRFTPSATVYHGIAVYRRLQALPAEEQTSRRTIVGALAAAYRQRYDERDI